jgi:hypothetical protein
MTVFPASYASSASCEQTPGVADVLQQALELAHRNEATLKCDKYFNSMIRGYVAVAAVRPAIDTCTRAFDSGVSVQAETFDAIIKLCLSSNLAEAAFALMGKRPGSAGKPEEARSDGVNA